MGRVGVESKEPDAWWFYRGFLCITRGRGLVLKRAGSHCHSQLIEREAPWGRLNPSFYSLPLTSVNPQEGKIASKPTHEEMGPRPWHRFLMMLHVWCVTEIFSGHMPVFYGHFYKETYLTVELSLTWRSLVQKGCEALRVKKVEQRIFPTVWTSGPVILFIDSHSPWGLGTELELRTNMEDKLEEAQGLARAPTFYVSLCKLPWTPG